MMKSRSSTSARHLLHSKVCHQRQDALADSRKHLGRTAPAQARGSLRHPGPGCASTARQSIQWRSGRRQLVKLLPGASPGHFPTMRRDSQRRAVHQQPLLLAMGILWLHRPVLLQHLGMPAGLRGLRGLNHHDHICDYDNDDE